MKITVDPVTRLEGHLKIEVEVEGGQVVAAWSSGVMYRGFEVLLKGRDPRDAIHLTQRICGVCPVSHGLAAAKAVEDSFSYRVTDQTRLMRNLILGANYLQSHLLHFYHLAGLDYVKGPETPPFTPRVESDYRLPSEVSQAVVEHYVKALEMRRKAHQMGAIFAGKLPHLPAFAPGGVTETPTAEDVWTFGRYLDELRDFIEHVYLPDVQTIGQAYSDYFQLGKGPGNYLSFGAFDQPGGHLLPRGAWIEGHSEALDTSLIVEQVAHSRYEADPGGRHPANGETRPQLDKEGAYSWLKAPRYAGRVVEVGPLARMWISGEYRNGTSVMDRHVARALEARKLAAAMQEWLGQLTLNRKGYTPAQMPKAGMGEGLVEAPRGALGHWLEYQGGGISRYQVITPTCWNASPRDDYGQPGALEQALLGTPVADPENPIELLRIVHSFDPCLACAVHCIELKR
ncbi:MAG: nickel-dependent hydrogenase large subunit [Chitinophagales bacterium]